MTLRFICLGRYEWLSVFLILLGLPCLTSADAMPFTVIEMVNNSCKNSTVSSLFFLLKKGRSREFLDKDDVRLFIKDFTITTVSPFLFSALSHGQPLPAMRRNVYNVDEDMRLELLYIDALQERLIETEKIFVYSSKNPALLRWNNQTLLISEYKSTISISWSKSFPISSQSLHGVTSSMNDTTLTRQPHWRTSVDPRAISLSETSILIVFGFEIMPSNSIYVAYKPALSYGYVTSSGSMTFVTKEIQFEAHHRSDKNWIPFTFNDTVLFIQSINPFRLMHLSGGGSVAEKLSVVSESIAVDFFSESISIEIPWWRFGELRGGSTVVYLPDDDVFLSFLHSVTRVGQNELFAYYFAAYTFSSRAPFRLLSLSYPVVADHFYNGPWLHKKVSYCVYPTSLSVDGDVVSLAVGYQDGIGYELTFSLRKLKENLIDLDGK
jgi:hypothetical protein